VLYTVDPAGNVTSYAYDSLNRQTLEIDAYGSSVAATTTTAYDAAGNVLYTVDPAGHVTSYAYDSANRRTVEVDGYGSPVAATTTTVYDSAGNVLSTTDPLGHVTSYAYDSANRRTVEVDGYGTGLQRTTTTAYDAAGNVLSRTDARGTITSYAYDSDNRQVAQIDAYGTGLQRTATTVYDAAGLTVRTTDALGYTTTYGYDGLRRQVTLQTPAGGTATTVYDHDGNVLAHVDQLGHATSHTYDALNRQVTATDALTGVTTYGYDADGNRTKVTDADGNTTTMAYDALNRLTQQTDPLNHSATFAYDAAGRLTSTTDRNGRVRNVSYDALNRETGETWVTSGTTVNTQSFTYDADGNELTAVDANGAYTMAYDALNRMTSEQEPFGQTLTFTYDANDNRTAVLDSLSGTTTSVYDALNRLTVREFGGPGQTTLREDLTYTARDQIATESRYTDLAGTTGAGVTSYTYDGAMRLTKQWDYYANGTVLASYVYSYDQASRLVSEVDNGGSPLTYSYDGDNQLTATGTATYGYDINGNRNTTGYATGADNQMTADGTYTYTYDAEGNRLTKRNGTDLATYTYDNRNRMTGVVETVGGTLQAQATYVYDVSGKRLESDDYQGGVTTVTRYAYDGTNAWADLSGGNALVTRRLFLDGDDQSMARVASGGTAAWYRVDRQGSVRNIVNYAGASVLDQITYDAYGNKTAETTPANGDRYGYTGREWDVVVSLQYNRSRYYDPATGRWTSQDPLGFDGSDANLYRYVANNPMNATDPSGLFRAGDPLAQALLAQNPPAVAAPAQAPPAPNPPAVAAAKKGKATTTTITAAANGLKNNGVGNTGFVLPDTPKPVTVTSLTKVDGLGLPAKGDVEIRVYNGKPDNWGWPTGAMLGSTTVSPAIGFASYTGTYPAGDYTAYANYTDPTNTNATSRGSSVFTVQKQPVTVALTFKLYKLPTAPDQIIYRPVLTVTPTMQTNNKPLPIGDVDFIVVGVENGVKVEKTGSAPLTKNADGLSCYAKGGADVSLFRPQGKYAVSAVYEGDDNYASNTSPVEKQN
jgi:RHS repeat-associated protein